MIIGKKVEQITKNDIIKLLSSENYRIKTALSLSNSDRVKTAKLMNISQRTLYRIIKRQKIKL